MRKRLPLAALALAAIAGAVALAAAAGTRAKSPIVIGFAVANSGFMTSYDVPSDNFAKLYIDEVNKKGGVAGHPLKWVDSDTKSDRAVGPRSAQDVISKGAQIMIVSCDYDYGSPAAFVAVQKGMLAFFTCCESPKCGRQGVGPTAFTMGTGTPTQGAAAAEFAYYTKHWRKAYVMDDNTIEYDNTQCSYFKQRWQQLSGVKLVGSDVWQQSDTSVASQITRFKSLKTKPDFIEWCSYNPGSASALRQFRAAGIKTPVIGGDALDGVYWLKTVPHLSDFYIPTYGYIYGKDPRAEVNRVIALYKQKYGSLPPTSQGMAGYAMMQAITKALQMTHGDPDGAKLTKALESFRNVPLVVGPTTYTHDLHISLDRPETMNVVMNGKWKFVQILTVKKVPRPKF